MPLHNRRPQLLSLSITPCPSSSNSKSSDEVHTPLPTTPFSWTPTPMMPVPLIMTPDTPYFDMGAMGGMLGKSAESDVGVDEVPTEPEWTEEEDEMLQTYLLRPASTGAYPPGTLPPPEILDNMTTQILSRLSRSSFVSSLSSSGSSDTDVDADMDMDMEMEMEANSSTEVQSKPRSKASWLHSWSATRARLFRIARLESREALGGHTRNNSESIVPVPQQKLVRPKLVVLGNSGMSRQQHSMDNILGGSEQSIDEAVKLSSALQGQAMTASSSVLHSTSDLSSPVTFEFGPSIQFTASGSNTSATPSMPLPRTANNRKAPPAFPTAKSLPRPSLLQRGRSYTGADLARERGHGRNTSISSDDLDIDSHSPNKGAEDTSPMSSGNSLLALPPYGRPSVRRSLTSPVDTTFSSLPSPTGTAFSGGFSSSSSDTQEADPITPLNQTTFPQSALGMGHRTFTGFSDDSDSTPGSTPAITLTRTSPVSSPATSTPRLGASFCGGDETDSPTSEFANLCINPSILPSLPLALPFSSASTTTTRSTRPAPPPLSRSFSESASLSGMSMSNPAQLPSSTSIPSGLSSFLMPDSGIGSVPMSRPALSMSALQDGSSASTDNVREGSRENKRQRAMPFSGQSGAVFRPRLNPGLTVVVPSHSQGALGQAGEGLRSPFEHKAPSGSVKI